MIKNVYWSSCKLTINFVRFLLYLNFINRFPENSQISNLIKISPVGGEMIHADNQAEGQTDRHEANSRSKQYRERA